MTLIDRSSLHAEVVARLRTAIVDGELSPGSRINERELCERFGVSRTPLREALKVMASEGLVVLLPNRGARVATLTRADIEDTFTVMACLEALSGELACAHITEEQIAELRALHYEMLAHHARRDLEAYYRLNERIHNMILTASNNPVLIATHAGLALRIRRARYIADMPRDWWDQAVREHEQILDALIRRDGASIATLLRHHLERKIDIMGDSNGMTPMRADAVETSSAA